MPVPRSQYPPDFSGKSRLEYYSSLFNSIEINSIFYKDPKEATLRKWVESVPPGFQFTFKLSKVITHSKDLQFDRADVGRYFELIKAAGEKRGCVLVQFPPKLAADHFGEVENLLSSISDFNEDGDWKIAVEFRNISWYHPQTYDLLDEYGMCAVLQDLPKSTTPMIRSRAPFVYLRFHGPTGDYRGSYPDDVLQHYADLVNGWRSEGKTVYCYFNNTAGDAFGNLQRINELVDSVNVAG